ncbi:MAG: ThuA domain-containing protein [Balneolales bacterium]
MFFVIATAASAQEKQVLFIAGGPSHGFGSHEHLGGSTLLARTINEADIGVNATVVSGWPEDRSIFDNIDAVVIYSDGGRGHLMLDHIEEFREVMDRGVGLVNIHYAVEVPKGDGGDAMLGWMGGYFELNWSVNPHWVLSINELPNHPATNGVKPFELDDEWYYHMRFQENMKNITPIITKLPPKESLIREDGGHSNNPHVREAILLREEPQHMAWAYERNNGGRGFGFTGGHWHWNWGQESFHRLVANAIIWSAGVEVPEMGISVQSVSALELAEMTDDPIPNDWDSKQIQDMLDKANKIHD